MNNITSLLLKIATVLLITYSIFAFVLWEVNASKWSFVARYFLATAFVCIISSLSVLSYLNKK